MCSPIGRLPPWFFEDSLPHLLLRNNSIALSAVAPPGAQYTHRVIDVAGRVVSDDGRPSRPASGPLWRAHRVGVPCATIQQGGEAGGKKGASAHGRRGSRVGPCGIVGLCCRRRTL